MVGQDNAIRKGAVPWLVPSFSGVGGDFLEKVSSGVMGSYMICCT